MPRHHLTNISIRKKMGNKKTGEGLMRSWLGFPKKIFSGSRAWSCAKTSNDKGHLTRDDPMSIRRAAFGRGDIDKVCRKQVIIV